MTASSVFSSLCASHSGRSSAVLDQDQLVTVERRRATSKHHDHQTSKDNRMSEPEPVSAHYNLGTPVLTQYTPGQWLPAEVIEEHPDGTVTVKWKVDVDTKTSHITACTQIRPSSTEQVSARLNQSCALDGKCTHGRIKSYSHACGGGGLCEHGRSRTRCADCGGGSMCQHKCLRYRCRECQGETSTVSRAVAPKKTTKSKSTERRVTRARPTTKAQARPAASKARSPKSSSSGKMTLRSAKR